jgi:hypothetical protein
MGADNSAIMGYSIIGGYLATHKDTNEKYDLQVIPYMVTLKKGEAAECEFIITPLCTCCVDDEVMITVLNMSTGEETSTPLQIKFETDLTTILDPDELIEEKKFGTLSKWR